MAQGQRSRSRRDNRTWTWSPGLGLRNRHPPLPQTCTEMLGGGPTRVGNEGGGSLGPDTQSNSRALPEAWRPQGTPHSATWPEDSRCPDTVLEAPPHDAACSGRAALGPVLLEPRARACLCLGVPGTWPACQPEHAARCTALTCEASPGPAQAPWWCSGPPAQPGCTSSPPAAIGFLPDEASPPPPRGPTL